MIIITNGTRKMFELAVECKLKQMESKGEIVDLLYQKELDD